MAKTLNFNDVKLLTLHIVLKDEAKTNVHITAPTVDLVERLQSDLPSLQEKLKKGDKESIKLMYDLAADLISVNKDDIKLNGEQLRNEYKLDVVDLMVFFGAYLDFVAEIKNAKN